jgi:N-acyl-D-amino-acid deacylase
MNIHPFRLLPLLFLLSCQTVNKYDVIIRNGNIYDGSGSTAIVADIAIAGDTIAAIGNLEHLSAPIEIDASGLAVAPGFINMLSWANESLIQDGRSQGDIFQGVTLEVFGEGNSDGPLKDFMKENRLKRQGDIKYPIAWTTLREYLEYLEERGISCNVASFIGATTVRVNEIGYEDRRPTAEELVRMKDIVRMAMEDGAVGLASSLIYPPAFYAETEELIALAKVVAEYDGLYISHMRSEGDQLLSGLNEMIRITQEAKVRSEIYHLKAAGQKNWSKMDQVISIIDSVRSAGLPITANMYTYTAAATGLGACFPPWSQQGGTKAWVNRLKDPKTRARITAEILEPADNWENFYDLSGSPDRTLLVGFKNDTLKKYTGKTLSEVASIRNTPPVESLIDLVIHDNGDVNAVYFIMSEENVRKQIALPYMSFCSDSESASPEGVFLKSNPHPRAYGSFARLLGKYVRDEKLLTLEEAVRRLTSLPAENLRLDRRGSLCPGYFADIVLFNAESIKDLATFTQPHQLATGMVHVFVNGTQVLKDGVHTGAKPGRMVTRKGTAKKSNR